MEIRRHFVENASENGKSLGGRWGTIICSVCLGMVTKVNVPMTEARFTQYVYLTVQNDGDKEYAFTFKRSFFGDFDPMQLDGTRVICAVNRVERFFDDGAINGPWSEFEENDVLHILDGPNVGKTLRRFDKRNNRLVPLQSPLISALERLEAINKK